MSTTTATAITKNWRINNYPPSRFNVKPSQSRQCCTGIKTNRSMDQHREFRIDLHSCSHAVN